MNYLLLILVGIAGIFIGRRMATMRRLGAGNGNLSKINKERLVEKEGKKQMLLDFVQEKEKITNNDAERLLEVSDATATNYLIELKKEGKLTQVGKTGKSVYYKLPNA